MNPPLKSAPKPLAVASPALRASRAIVCAASAVLLLTCSRPAGAAPAGPTTAPAAAAAPVDIDDMPVTAPDVGGAPLHRTTGGARGGEAAPPPQVFLFAPETVGATSREHPTLYWYLTQPIEDDSELVVSREDATKPGEGARVRSEGRPGEEGPAEGDVVARKKFSGRQPAGIYSAALGDVALEPGKTYRVTAIIHHRVRIDAKHGRKEEIYSIGHLVYRPQRDHAGAGADPKACATAGLWYDAVDAAVRGAEKDPKDPVPHRQLHGLLWREHVLRTTLPEAAPATEAEDALRREERDLKQLAAGGDAVVTPQERDKAK